jgi:hypothetical protein
MPSDVDAVRRWLDDIHHHIILAGRFADGMTYDALSDQQFSLCRSGGFFELLPRLNGDFDAFLPSG